jgi:hypothetical protein
VTPDEPWSHDLKTNASSTDLWPTLLLVALLLWPLDIALRRVSVGRRELVDARRWLAGGWRRSMAPRTAAVAGMLAARDRAAGSASRAALLRPDEPPAGPSPSSTPPASLTSPVRPASAGTASRPESAVSRSAAGPAAAPTSAPQPSAAPPASPPAAPAPAPADEGDTLSRLRDAKRRARER